MKRFIARCWMFTKCLLHQSVDPHTELLLLRAHVFREFVAADPELTTSVNVMCYIKRLADARDDGERVSSLLVEECKKLRTANVDMLATVCTLRDSCAAAKADLRDALTAGFAAKHRTI